MPNYYTENLAQFGYREIVMLRDILNAWVANGLPEGFYTEEVRPAMNFNSGNVFLVNAEYQVAMMNGDNLELFYSLPYGGLEGFLSDLLEENNPADLHKDDIQYLIDAADQMQIVLSDNWMKHI